MNKSTKGCKHNWVIHTTTESDFRCTKCGRYGKHVQRHIDGIQRWVIRANTDR